MFEIFQDVQDIIEEEIRKVEMCRAGVLHASFLFLEYEIRK